MESRRGSGQARFVPAFASRPIHEWPLWGLVALAATYPVVFGLAALLFLDNWVWGAVFGVAFGAFGLSGWLAERRFGRRRVAIAMLLLASFLAVTSFPLFAARVGIATAAPLLIPYVLVLALFALPATRRRMLRD